MLGNELINSSQNGVLPSLPFKAKGILGCFELSCSSCSLIVFT
jgi:hypothetical protein